MAGVVIGITAMAWNISAEREVRTRFPEEGRFYPSRWWVYSYEYVYRADLYEQVEQADYRARASQEARIGAFHTMHCWRWDRTSFRRYVYILVLTNMEHFTLTASWTDYS